MIQHDPQGISKCCYNMLQWLLNIAQYCSGLERCPANRSDKKIQEAKQWHELHHTLVISCYILSSHVITCWLAPPAEVSYVPLCSEMEALNDRFDLHSVGRLNVSRTRWDKAKVWLHDIAWWLMISHDDIMTTRFPTIWAKLIRLKSSLSVSTDARCLIMFFSCKEIRTIQNISEPMKWKNHALPT